MKNVTIAIDDETHRNARIRAAELGTSLSALVKGYLQNLAGDPASQTGGAREMPMTFSAKPAAFPIVPNPDNAPYFINGKWVFTKDGKPRKPGGLKGNILITDDLDKWPAEIAHFFDKLQNEPFDGDSFDPLP